ncbi:uncharacterized protein DFL_003762 [Arthrobotrys flagrans]|uniref:Uncharacterized protein n=1 Tax=Arthrobotrys flagrans TaxID=97331 RepID=A0A437A2U9_ARTFL|nr:hypothetical protein DFL_003762 [Arthrobotrys flagrans]
MRWLRSLAVYAGVAAGLTQAAVPEALSEAFVSGMTLSVKFGDTGIQDDSTASVGSITSSPVFTLNSPNIIIPDNTRYTIILMDITDSRNPTTEAVLHYAASNLRAPQSDGGDLIFGTVNFEYIPPAANTDNADYLFLVYAQLDGEIELNLQSVPEPGEDRLFSVNIFRQDNLFQLADTGVGFTVRPASVSNTSTTSSSFSTTSFTFPNTTTTFSSSIPSSTPDETSTIPSNSTTTSSSSESSSESSTSSESTPPPQPQEPSTSYLTLSVSGSTRTVIYTAPNDPGSTLAPSQATTADPSLITNEPSAASQTIVSRAAIILGLYIALFAFI